MVNIKSKVPFKKTAVFPAAPLLQQADGWYMGYSISLTYPVCKSKYPKTLWDWYSQRFTMPDILDGDMEIIHTPIDYLGVNYYTSIWIEPDDTQWPLGLRKVKHG